jgi:hypothetical protein
MEGGVMQTRAHRNIAAFDASIAMLRGFVSHLEQRTTHSKGGRKR